MTRGKHSAKAANRLAHTENELVQELKVKCNNLRDEVAQLNRELTAAERDRDALILRRSAEIAEESIRHLAELHESEMKKLERQRFDLAINIAAVFSAHDNFPRFMLFNDGAGGFDLLVPQELRSEFANAVFSGIDEDHPSTRAIRRQGAKNIARNNRDELSRMISIPDSDRKFATAVIVAERRMRESVGSKAAEYFGDE